MPRKYVMAIIVGEAVITATILLALRYSHTDYVARHLVRFEYDHRAKVREIRIRSPYNGTDMGPLTAFGQSCGGNSCGWAVFVICSIDVQGSSLPTYTYDVSKFYVELAGKKYGPLQPLQVTPVNGSPNNAALTPKTAQAIKDKLQIGPDTQVFAHGLHLLPAHQIAILIPTPHINGELVLKYSDPSILKGRNQQPQLIDNVGPDNRLEATSCRPVN